MQTTLPRAVQRIPRAPLGAGDVACVVRQAGYRELGDWQRLIHDPYIAPDLGRLDRAWNWPRYLTASYMLNDLQGRLTEAFQIVVASPAHGAVPVGQAMLVSGYPHPGQPNRASAFVWYLTSTPATALQAMGITERFAVLPLLLDTAVQASRWQGLDGRLALHADHRGTHAQNEDLVRRYTACGLNRRNHLRGLLLSLFRRMDDRYFVYDEASAHACTLRWNSLR